MMPHRSIKILGTPVACVTYQSAFEIVRSLARESRPTAVCPANTHILSEARHDPNFEKIMARFDLVLPDGMPVVWALNLRGAGLSDRVYGPYFMKYVLQRTPRPWRHFFFGDSEECLVQLQKVAPQFQPEIEIVGAERVSARKLRKHIDLKINKPLNEEELEKGRQKIIDIYQAKGFTNIDVKFHVDADEARGRLAQARTHHRQRDS